MSQSFFAEISVIMYVRAHIQKSFLIKKFIFSYLYQISPYICSVERGY